MIIAENDLVVARQRLAQLAFYRPDGTFVPRTLEPTEERRARGRAASTSTRRSTTALAERPEVRASARGVQVQVS